MVKVYNRNECCWDRLSDFTVSVLDANMNVIASENYPGPAPRYEAVTIDFSASMPEGEYVEVELEGTSCLQLTVTVTEDEIFGYEIIPPAYNLVSGAQPLQLNHPHAMEEYHLERLTVIRMLVFIGITLSSTLAMMPTRGGK